MQQHLNYILKTPRPYRPHIFKSIADMDHLLARKILVNQSHHTLSPEEIEILITGLKFIPSLPCNLKSTQHHHTTANTRWLRSINLALHFNDPKNRLPRKLKGHLHALIPSLWDPPPQLWESNPTTQAEIEKLNQPQPSQNEPLHANLRAAITSLNIPSIHVIPADKGGAICVIDTEDYDREADRQLADHTSYREMTIEEYDLALKNAHTEACLIAEGLHFLGKISDEEYQLIKSNEPKGSAIYYLPKIHKKFTPCNTIPGRPIVAAHSCVVRYLDLYITAITKHLLPLIPGSLRDTTHLLTSLPKDPLPASACLITADVDSLYPTIPWDTGIAAATAFYKEHYTHLTETFEKLNQLPPPTPEWFERILTFVLTNSYITYKNKRFFHQTRGTAMGMSISVYFANTYMYSVTKHLLTGTNQDIVTFFRFIDDLFLILRTKDTKIIDDIFQSITIKDTTTYTRDPPSSKVSFLDVYVLINQTNQLETEPFTKPTSTQSYIHYKSAHPLHTLNAIPYAQFTRLRRISTRVETFERSATVLMRAFRHRGYPQEILEKHYLKVLNTSREQLLQKQTKKFDNSFKFIVPFTPTIDLAMTTQTLKRAYQAITQNYPAGYRNHELLKHRRPGIVYTTTQPTANLFTKTYKNPNE